MRETPARHGWTGVMTDDDVENIPIRTVRTLHLSPHSPKVVRHIRTCCEQYPTMLCGVKEVWLMGDESLDFVVRSRDAYEALCALSMRNPHLHVVVAQPVEQCRIMWSLCRAPVATLERAGKMFASVRSVEFAEICSPVMLRCFLALFPAAESAVLRMDYMTSSCTDVEGTDRGWRGEHGCFLETEVPFDHASNVRILTLNGVHGTSPELLRRTCNFRAARVGVFSRVRHVDFVGPVWTGGYASTVYMPDVVSVRWNGLPYENEAQLGMQELALIIRECFPGAKRLVLNVDPQVCLQPFSVTLHPVFCAESWLRVCADSWLRRTPKRCSTTRSATGVAPLREGVRSCVVS